jgi:DNA-binding Lrp family transcriptional regulator
MLSIRSRDGISQGKDSMAEESKRQTDWERVEYDYRAGLLSVREIADSQGISHTAVSKRAKKEGWERDLTARIKAKAEALVSKAEVSKEVANQRLETERVIVESNALAIANIRLAHRKDISRARNVSLDLLAELEHETANPELFEELGELLRSEDDKAQDKRNDIYRRVISSAGRIDSMKKLADTLKTLIGLEREAYGLANAADGDSPGSNPARGAVFKIVRPE